MAKKQIQTDKAPGAIGPYSQAVKVGKWVFTAGQIPIEPVSGNMVSGHVKDKTRQVMENIKDAIRLHIEDRVENGEEIPQAESVSLTLMEVAV